MKQKRRRNKSYIVRFIVLGVSVYMVVSLVGLYNTLNKDLEILTALQQELETKTFEIEQLEELLESGSHKAIIEKAARERLGFVYADEEIYIDTSGN